MLLPLALRVVIRVSFGDGGGVEIALFVVSVIGAALAIWSFCHITLLAAHVKKTGAPQETLPNIQGLALPVFFSFFIYGLVVFIGFFAIVPGVLFAVWFAFAPVIAVLERRGVFSALGESRALVRGWFWRTLFSLWSMDALFLLAYLLVVLAIDLLLGYDLAHLDATAPLPVSMDIVLSVFEIIAAPLVVVYHTVLYLAMKNR